jgi:hypothetical protein
MTALDAIITPEEREEIERSVDSINRMLNRGTMLCAAIVDFIDARFEADDEA